MMSIHLFHGHCTKPDILLCKVAVISKGSLLSLVSSSSEMSHSIGMIDYSHSVSTWGAQRCVPFPQKELNSKHVALSG